MEAVLFALATFLSTLVGGLFAVNLKNKLPLIMGFSAGVLLGVVAFDIFPEIILQVNKNHFQGVEPMIGLVLGFLIFHILEKVVVIHHAHEIDYADHHHPDVGVLGALALAGHSFMDGVGIGWGFQVNAGVGLLVAVAVISHDFTDGINTVTLMLGHGNSSERSKSFLVLDAITPLAGVLFTFFFSVSPRFLVWYLGFFAGFLLYIGTSDILPEAHSKRSSFPVIGLTVLGTVVIFLISRFTG